MTKVNKRKINPVKLIQKIGKVLYGSVFVLLVVIAGLIVISSFRVSGNYKLYSVQSGSMEPAIKTGSIVVVKPDINYQKGDVITVVEPANPKVSLTHRIVEVKEKDGKTSYITKGDANNSPDTEERPKENIVGKVLFSLPLLGYPVSFGRTQTGLIVLIIVPATLLIYSEMLTIKKETIRLIQEHKGRKLTSLEKVEKKIGQEEIEVEKGIKKLFRKIFKKEKKK